MDVILPVLYVLLKAREKYAENKDGEMSQAMPSPNNQMWSLHEQQLQSVGKRKHTREDKQKHKNNWVWVCGCFFILSPCS